MPRFGTQVNDRRERRQCNCWDCLRAEGITPPGMLRDKYQRLYPRTVMIGHSPPRPAKKTSKSDYKPIEAGDNAHLKEAIRNRVT